jgi:hypothetical protein
MTSHLLTELNGAIAFPFCPFHLQQRGSEGLLSCQPTSMAHLITLGTNLTNQDSEAHLIPSTTGRNDNAAII